MHNVHSLMIELIIINYKDIRTEILSLISDHDKNMLLSTNKEMYKIKFLVIFNTKIYFNKQTRKIKYLSSFTNVVISDIQQFNILKNVTHLTFHDDFNQDITKIIPDNVTHITFGYHFNKSILGVIPNNVQHLTFGHKFNKPILNAIPKNVTHLTFDHKFNQSILNAIPDNVQHLTFGKLT